MLLNGFSIPNALVFTYTLLRTRYSLHHMVGASVCVSGIILIVFLDVHPQDGQGGGQHVGLGDFLAVCAAILYTCSSIGHEFYLQKVDFSELLAHACWTLQHPDQLPSVTVSWVAPSCKYPVDIDLHSPIQFIHIIHHHLRPPRPPNRWLCYAEPFYPHLWQVGSCSSCLRLPPTCS